jgi:hypothetical protein
MTSHRAESATENRWYAATLITKPVDATVAGRHHGFVRALLQMARARRWHAFWCRLGDSFDELGDRVIAWVGIVLAAIAAVAVGAVIGFAAGPVAAGAYIAALAVAGVLARRMQRRTS